MTVRLIATGGTIASLADPETGAVRPAVSAEDLVRSVPDLGEVEVESVAHVNGWNMTPATMLEVARRVSASRCGVVVTHGTDTVEETAFLCDLTVASDRPVVFAAAMRSGAVARGLPVVVATRVPTGGTGAVYGGPGGGVTVRELGAIAAGALPAAKARLLLMLLLAGGGDVRRRFEDAVDTLTGW